MRIAAVTAAALVLVAAACTPKNPPPNYDVGPTMEEKVALFPYFVIADAQGTVRWGFLDTAGQPRVEPGYAEVREYIDGRAAVRVEPGGPWGYIDGEGRMAIAAQFEEARDFHQGRAAVKSYGSWDYIDESGKKASELRLPGVLPLGDFAGGLAVVDLGGKKGYVGLDGKVAIPSQFTEAGPFSDGLAQVVPDGSDLAGFIDPKGALVIEPRFTFTAARFEDGLAAVEEAGKALFIDATGKPAFEGRFDDARSFTESVAAVKQNFRWGYIDRGGTFVLDPQWDDAQPFSEGLASVLIDGKRGYIDRQGKVSIPPTFDRAGPFRDGVASVELESKPALIDRAGAPIWRAP